MKPEELAGIGRAVAEQIDAGGADVLRQCQALLDEIRQACADQMAEVQRSTGEQLQGLRAQLAEAHQQLALMRQETHALRAAADNPIAAMLLDAEGVLHIVQRNGERLAVRLPNVEQLVHEAAQAQREQIGAELRSEISAAVARSFELHTNAAPWNAASVYTEGQIVQCYSGRTYRVRKGIAATLGREPGDHPDHWERLGTAGLRVLKSRPAELQPGDMFTENDARFLHDGCGTVLIMPKAPKVSDIERAVKLPYGVAQAGLALGRELSGRVEALSVQVQRSEAAANDASEHGIQALATTEELRAELAALRARLDAAGG